MDSQNQSNQAGVVSQNPNIQSTQLNKTAIPIAINTTTKSSDEVEDIFTTPVSAQPTQPTKNNISIGLQVTPTQVSVQSVQNDSKTETTETIPEKTKEELKPESSSTTLGANKEQATATTSTPAKVIKQTQVDLDKERLKRVDKAQKTERKIGTQLTKKSDILVELGEEEEKKQEELAEAIKKNLPPDEIEDRL